MVEDLEDYMCRYIQQQTEPLKGCLLAILESREQYLSILDESLGTPIQSVDIKRCELLTDAGLMREDIKLTRDGRNTYKVFYLTDRGREIAQQTRLKGYMGPVPQTTPLDNI
ncbi:MAG: hypothetical protein NWE92_12295 [Candidatus Bathyarchaeota archaeon]|nr:hypothetical protein [Candidatus Bathyarchaeota archaeon]